MTRVERGAAARRGPAARKAATDGGSMERSAGARGAARVAR